MVVIILLSFFAVFFACLSQKKKVPIEVEEAEKSVTVYKYEKTSSTCFAISFLILAAGCFFCGEGTDMAEYVYFYNSWTLASLKDLSFEAGYILSNLFLRVFFKNAYIGLGIIKILSIFLVYKSLYMLRDRLNLGMSVLSYVLLLYIFNFHLLRMMLALSIVFLALTYELLGKSKKAIFLLVLAFAFHYTSIIVLFTYIMYKMLGKKMTVAKITVFSLVLILVYGNIMPILNKLISTIDIFDKYATYLNRAYSYIGVAQIVLFIPIVYILINSYRQGRQDKFYMLNTMFGIMLFFAGALGYLLPVISRTVYYFFWFAVSFFAATPLIKDKYVFVIGNNRINLITLASFLYLAMQFVIVYLLDDALDSAGLMQYTFFWNK